MTQSNGPGIATHAPGYVMYLSHETLDLLHFDQFTNSGRDLAAKGMHPEAAHCFRSAIGLWRGPVADGIDADAVRVAATRLHELRDGVLEDCLDLELAMGRHRQLIGELAALVAEYPLRESMRAKHMLALYRAGRTCDALQSYRAGRDILRDELGLEPSAELRSLERAILNQDPRLTWRPAR
jgi:DNA-binding SARP family transcriptional activator